MIKYCANMVAMSKYKLSKAGDPYDIKVEGKNVIGSYQGKQAFKTTSEFFKDNFFQVETKLK